MKMRLYKTFAINQIVSGAVADGDALIANTIHKSVFNEIEEKAKQIQIIQVAVEQTISFPDSSHSEMKIKINNKKIKYKTGTTTNEKLCCAFISK